MADVKKTRKRDKKTSGRVTESTPSARYTPPSPDPYRPSPLWVPVSMFTFFALGVIVIILNYLPGAPLLPGETANKYLLIGLGFIFLGFISASRYR